MLSQTLCSIPCQPAGAAVSSSRFWIDVKVLAFVRMSLRAMCLGKVWTSLRSAIDVLKACYQLQVTRPNTGAVSASTLANVIPFEADRSLTNQECVSKDDFAPETKLPVAVLGGAPEPEGATVSAARVNLCPKPLFRRSDDVVTQLDRRTAVTPPAVVMIPAPAPTNGPSHTFWNTALGLHLSLLKEVPACQ